MRATTSVGVPSHAGAPISASQSNVVAGRPSRSTRGAAVSWARRSGDTHSSSTSRSAIRSASASAWRRPRSVSGGLSTVRPSRAHSGSPWRMSTTSMRGEPIAPPRPVGDAPGTEPAIRRAACGGGGPPNSRGASAGAGRAPRRERRRGGRCPMGCPGRTRGRCTPWWPGRAGSGGPRPRGPCGPVSYQVMVGAWGRARRSADDRPHDETDADGQCRADEHVVERGASVLSMRIESHVTSIAVPRCRRRTATSYAARP